MFEERNSFANHVSLLQSYIGAIPNLSEHDKKQLLVMSADSKVGDFHLTVSELVNVEFYQAATFDEIIVVLDNIYVSKEGCSV